MRTLKHLGWIAGVMLAATSLHAGPTLPVPDAAYLNADQRERYMLAVQEATRLALTGAAPRIVNAPTKAAVTATTTSSTVLAANASRSDAVIVNYGATPCFLARGATAVSGQGIYLAAGGGAYSIDANNLYRGQITVITTSGTTTIAVSEGN